MSSSRPPADDATVARPMRARALPASPPARVDATLTLVPTARAAFLLGGRDPHSSSLRADAWRLDLDTLAWSALPFAFERAGHSAVAVGDAVLLFGGRGAPGAHALWRLDARTNAIARVVAAGGGDAPSPRAGHAACFTGREMLVWGGRDADEAVLADGAAYDPARDAWRAIRTPDAPRGRSEAALVWTGREALLAGGSDDVSMPGELGVAAYDPARDAWRTASSHVDEPAPFAGSAALAWSAGALFVAASSGLHAYEPVHDRWRLAEPFARRGAAVLAHPRGGVVLLGGVSPRGEYDGDALRLEPDAAAVARVTARVALPGGGREDALVAYDGAIAVVLYGRRGAGAWLGDGAVIELGD